MNIKLTDLKVKSLVSKEKKYKVFDKSVSGLYLMVMPSGYKVFKLAYRIGKYQKESTLGEYPILPLADARAQAVNEKQLIQSKDRVDVSSVKAQEKRTQNLTTLNEVCLKWLEEFKTEYPKKYPETRNRMVKHLFPYFDKKLIQDIKRQDIKDFLTHMKKKGIRHTALRIKQNLVHVWNEARDRELVRENIVTGITFKKTEHTHQVAEVNPDKFALLLNRIDSYKFSNVHIEVGIKLLAHLFPRHSELVAMKWEDINYKSQTWEYMQTKTGDVRLVPLSKQVIALLNSLKSVGSADHSEYVFPSDKTKTGHISSFRNEFLKIINPDEHTIHGFRASARTMLQQYLKYSPDVIEHQLGHVVPDRLGKSYNRTTHIEDRIPMMTDWSNYLDEIKRNAKQMKVVNKDD